MKRSVFRYGISEIAPYIDWSYLLHAWGLNEDKAKAGSEEVVRDAQAMLAGMNGRYFTQALFALCDAKSAGDDIVVEGKTIHLLRQQHALTGKPNLCLSDFVSPHGDKLGLFATSVDGVFGEEYKDDAYLHLLAQTLADRLAEATATFLHMNVRRDDVLWGYAAGEELAIEDMLAEKNQGIRPAVGYPSLPDQSVIFDIDKLIDLGGIGITLTPNGAMTPHASVCGMMFAHRMAQYFAVGRITEEQLVDYAQRKGENIEKLKKFLTRNVASVHNG